MKSKPAITAEPQQVISAAMVLCAAVAGIAAAWVAAGSAGLLAHGLRHAITWVLLLLIAAFAWPNRGLWWQKLAVVAALIAAIALTAPTIATLNVLGVALFLAALAAAHVGQLRAILSSTAQATAVLALFQFAQASIASFWQVINSVAGAVGATGGAVAGQPLNVGATFAGLDYLVVAFTVIGLFGFKKRLSPKACGLALVAIVLGHLAYLAVVAQSERIVTAARTMRAERVFATSTQAELEALVQAIKFEPPPLTTSASGSPEQESAQVVAQRQRDADAALEAIGLERADLHEIVSALIDDAAFPRWVSMNTRAALLDKLKAPLEALQKSRLDGPASRAPYTLDGFLLAAVPWNLPAVALLVYTTLIAVVMWFAFLRTPPVALVLVPDRDAAQRVVPRSAAAPSSRRWVLIAPLAIVAVLLPIVTVYAPSARSYRGKKIVAYEKGFLNWLKPEYGNMRDNINFGRLSVGMYGMLEPFAKSLGMKFARSKNLAADDLDDADVLILFYPNRRWKRSQLDRIEDFVRRGGSLLVAGEHTVHEVKKKPGALIYPGEEDDQTLPAGEEWAGDEEGNRVNDLVERFGMQTAFDSAEFAVGGWLQSYATVSHPTTTGLRDERNTFGAVIGASVEAPWPARPMILGRYGVGDTGDLSKQEGGSYMGDGRYNAGERLGDIVLAAEKQVGEGRVILFGDTSSFTNNLTVSGHPFTARLYAYLAAPDAANPQSAWWQAAGWLLLAAALALVLVCGEVEGVMALVMGLAGALWLSTILTAAANEVFPSGEYGPPAPANEAQSPDEQRSPSDTPKNAPQPPNNLAYIDASHHSAASDESLRPDGIMGITYMLMRQNYLTLSLPELTGERLMDEPERRDYKLGVESLKARLVVTIAPQREYSEKECDILDEFVARGGRLIIMAGADDSGPAQRLLERFDMQVGTYASPSAYGVVQEGTTERRVPIAVLDEWPTATRVDLQPRYKQRPAMTSIPSEFIPRLDQQPREATPLGHFKDAYNMVQDDLVTYKPFVRFHAGWPISCTDETALVIAPRFSESPLPPLIIIKSHSAGLVALIGDTGFAMNKNLEREDGSPIEGLRENAFFWRWFLDVLEYGSDNWLPPREVSADSAADSSQQTNPLQIPLLKTDLPRDNLDEPASPAGDKSATTDQEGR